VIAAVEDMLVPALLAFCRLGACLILLPGISSARVPVRVRLTLALAISAVLSPWIAHEFDHASTTIEAGRLLTLVATETFAGAVLGFMTRALYAGLQFAALIIASVIGFAGVFEASIEDGEPSAPVASLVTITATVLWFLTDQHLGAVQGLLASYEWLRIDRIDAAIPDLKFLSDILARSFDVALRLSAPFILYGILINAVFGILNRMIPQIPVYFISMPFVIAGGLIVLLLLFGPALDIFMTVVTRHAERG
jgi:flagellar biosynthetic protein FliR